MQAIENPAKEFARKSEEARRNLNKGLKKNLPLGSIGLGNLQQNVLFGFGEKKVEQAADNVAGDVKEAAGDAKGAVKDVAKEVRAPLTCIDS